MKRLKIRKKYKISKILLLTLTLIFFLTFFLIKIYSKKVTPKIIEVAETKITKFTESFLSNNIGYDILNDNIIDNILVINKNDDNEILYVDYNLNQAYKALEVVTDEINTLINNLENGEYKNYQDNDIEFSDYGLTLKLPLFVSSNSPLFANLGPKIYLKIN